MAEMVGVNWRGGLAWLEIAGREEGGPGEQMGAGEPEHKRDVACNQDWGQRMLCLLAYGRMKDWLATKVGLCQDNGCYCMAIGRMSGIWAWI